MSQAKNIFVQGPISPETIAASIASHSSKTEIGAHSIFLGQIRQDEQVQGSVTAIEYSAYESMALDAATLIREDLFSKYPIKCLHIYHSLGLIKTGEICLFVFVSAAHRQAATAACHEAVERIKAELPVWGKEIFENNETLWKTNR